MSDVMAVIYKCVYCGCDIKSDCVYDGPALDFPKFIEEKTKALSEKCSCRKQKNEMANVLKKYGRNK